jgi:NAD(P)-dependent dehydrogenase (short-subunit alcohol dehydrogenase family)
MPRLDGKTAIITGGNSGIGLATARAFLAEGASRVYLTGRRKVELDTAVESLNERAVAVQGDVTNPADLDRLYARVKTEVGQATSSSRMRDLRHPRPSAA